MAWNFEKGWKVKSPSRVKVNVKESLNSPPPSKTPNKKDKKNVFSFVSSLFFETQTDCLFKLHLSYLESPPNIIHFHKAYIAVAECQKPTVMYNK